MAITDIQFPEHVINVHGGEVVVRGLSINDMIKLISRHADKLAVLWKMIGDDEPPQDVAAWAANDAPELFTDILAAATGAQTEEERRVLERLPAGLQFEVFVMALNLTFQSQADLELLIGMLTEMVQRAVDAMNQAVPPGLGNSSGDTGNTQVSSESTATSAPSNTH